MRNWILIALATSAAIGHAETAAAGGRDGKQVVAEAVQALGGDKFLSMQDRVSTGWTTSWQRSGSRLLRTKFYNAYPADGAVTRHTYDKQESHALLVKSDGAYEITFRGSRPIEKDRADRLVMQERLNVLNVLRMQFSDAALTYDYRGSTVCELQSGELVDIVSEDHEIPVVTVCFSKTTHLPIRQSYFQRDPLTKERIEEVTLFSRYLDADGVTWPRQVAFLRDGEPVRDLFYESTEVNKGLNAEMFATPGTMVSSK